ncbi:MAG: hypothetical protein MJ057_07275 [Sphaerochaetaceae bacterium]|nr:hypothetical protein [Sphaerochaetaceae bacterium]
MKKILVIMIVAVVAATSVFAGFRMGIDQSLVTTSVSLSYDFGRWAEVGGSVGTSLILGTSGMVEDIQEGTQWYVAMRNMIALPRAEFFAHFKAVDTPHFDFRLGVRGTAQGEFFQEDDYLILLMASPVAEVSYKFDNGCRIYLNGSYPLLGTGIGDGGLGSAFYTVLVGIFDQMVHLGVSWDL